MAFLAALDSGGGYRYRDRTPVHRVTDAATGDSPGGMFPVGRDVVCPPTGCGCRIPSLFHGCGIGARVLPAAVAAHIRAGCRVDSLGLPAQLSTTPSRSVLAVRMAR